MYQVEDAGEYLNRAVEFHKHFQEKLIDTETEYKFNLSQYEEKYIKMTNKDRLNELYKKYGLTTEDYFKHKHYTIITRSGIDKVQAQANILIEYDICKASEDNKHIIIQAFASMGDKVIQTFGESSPQNTTNAYPVAMAEKRAMSRAVLKLTGFYELGGFGEDESDDFKKHNK